jgi:hypothetical protein
MLLVFVLPLTFLFLYVSDWTDDTTTFTLVDQFSTVQSPPKCNRNSIYSSKQTRSKYQTSNRPSSLPPTRHSFSSPSSLDENIEEEVKQRRRYASDSQTNQKPNTPTLLVSSFLRYLRNELRATTSDKKSDYHKRIKKVKKSELIIHSLFLSWFFLLRNPFQTYRLLWIQKCQTKISLKLTIKMKS